jgi:hypothetical protein
MESEPMPHKSFFEDYEAHGTELSREQGLDPEFKKEHIHDVVDEFIREVYRKTPPENGVADDGEAWCNTMAALDLLILAVEAEAAKLAGYESWAAFQKSRLISLGGTCVAHPSFL